MPVPDALKTLYPFPIFVHHNTATTAPRARLPRIRFIALFAVAALASLAWIYKPIFLGSIFELADNW